jgi:transposase
VENSICGVDVSKQWLDAFAAEQHERMTNNPEGIARLAAFCQAHDVTLVVMEATGGVERQAYAGLWQAGQPCTLVNPRNVRDFAKAMGYLEKTDRLDATVIAHFAAVKKLTATPPPSEKQQILSTLSARLRQVISDSIVQKQRRSATQDNLSLSQIDDILMLLKKQRQTLCGEIASLIDDDPLWCQLDASFRSIKGVADRTVATLMAELPEIGCYSNKAISKLVGLAPIADDSGKRQGKRAIRGGRAYVRSMLFLVANIARKYDQSLQAFADRLLKAGKAKMVVRVALAHKLLVRLNAKARITRENYANAT